ncbi:hypothetical protein ACJRO7_008779 [Eucalyptus globulus]|uniref:Uncharacterized protein n=1 Tax=Eucalyptus globulus TaxID=34317 RepID=A0ABD3ISX1_EUCGL
MTASSELEQNTAEIKEDGNSHLLPYMDCVSNVGKLIGCSAGVTKDYFVVACFGDQERAPDRVSLIKPLWEHFQLMEKQSGWDKLRHAVDCALGELSSGKLENETDMTPLGDCYQNPIEIHGSNPEFWGCHGMPVVKTGCCISNLSERALTKISTDQSVHMFEQDHMGMLEVQRKTECHINNLNELKQIPFNVVRPGRKRKSFTAPSARIVSICRQMKLGQIKELVGTRLAKPLV